jgi:hypothetical protein
MLWCCVEPERIEKTTPIMEAVAAGFGGRICCGEPPDDGEMFIVWGQRWTALQAIPKAIRQGRPYLQLDNGFTNPARGGPKGYYRISYNGPGPVFWPDAPPDRTGQVIRPWRGTGRHILVGLPGVHFGRAWGLSMDQWIAGSITILRRHTRRQAYCRHKNSIRPLAHDLRDCWAVYTHSSNIAVDAVLAGIPAFVAPTNPAAPVGNLDLANIETPAMPERQPWLNSLMAQQYTLCEMRSGLARDYLGAVIALTKGIANGHSWRNRDGDSIAGF